MRSETVLNTKVDMASALWHAGDNLGLSQMTAMCADPATPFLVVSRIANQLYNGLHRTSTTACVPPVLDALKDDSDDGHRLTALGLVHNIYPDTTKEQSDWMIAEAKLLLNDRDPSVRMAAAQALRDLGALQKASPRVSLPPPSDAHTNVMPDITVPFDFAPGGSSVFDGLLAIGLENHIPIGIVMDSSRGLCQTPFQLAHGPTAVTNLIASIDKTVPGYHATLQNGVLEITPLTLSAGASALLSMNIERFNARDNIHAFMGQNVWMYVRAVIAPREGFAGGGFSATSTERVTGFEAQDQTVHTLLNRIATKGSGAVWILHSSMAENLSNKSRQPFQIEGYGGNEQKIKSIHCSD